MGSSKWLGLHHVQLAIPAGAEEQCREFYCLLLGWSEIAKPPALAGRGGLWLHTESFEVHLGVEKDFRPARKAHPAFLISDTDLLAQRLDGAGYQVEWDQALLEYSRFYTNDCVGNRLEFLEAKPATEQG